MTRGSRYVTPATRCECTHDDHAFVELVFVGFRACHRSPRIARRVCSTCAQDHAVPRSEWNEVVARRRELLRK